jgi:protein-tyrosine sulfotransferase
MMTYGRAAQTLRFECHLIGVIWRSSKCLPSRGVLSVGLGGALGPWDLIPDRIPVFGHLDELSYILVSLAIARLLMPPRLVHHVARQLSNTRDAHGDQWVSVIAMPSAKAQSALLSRALVLRRRIMRLGAYTESFARNAWSRWTAAIGCRDLGGFLFTLLGYRLWWRFRAAFAPFRSHSRSIIVIGGAARSGTTLLRTALGRHPLIASGPEATVFLRRVSSPADLGARLGWDATVITRWQRECRSQVEFIEQFQRATLARAGKPIWVEKTPRNVQRFGFVRRRFPHAKLVHIVRDGRDVVCSLRREPFAKLDEAPWNSVAAARRCAVQWRTSVKAGLRFRGDPAYYELRYEDLVHEPEATLQALLKFLGVPWDDCVLNATTGPVADPDEATAAGAIFGSSIGRWRRDLSHADRIALRSLIGPLVVELGYGGTAWSGPTLASVPTADGDREDWSFGANLQKG